MTRLLDGAQRLGGSREEFGHDDAPHWTKCPPGSRARDEALVRDALKTGVTGLRSIAMHAGVSDDVATDILNRIQGVNLKRRRR